MKQQAAQISFAVEYPPEQKNELLYRGYCTTQRTRLGKQIQPSTNKKGRPNGVAFVVWW